MVRLRHLASVVILYGVLPIAGQAADPRAEHLLEAAKQATGGAAWDKLGFLHLTGTLAANGLAGTFETWLDVPTGKGASTYVLGPASGGQGWDGKTVWTTDSSGEVRIERSDEAVAAALQDAYRGSFAFFFPKRWPAEIAYAGTRSADGKTYEAITVTPKGAEPLEIWFDPATKRVTREVQITGEQKHSFLLDDWRAVNGVKIPYREIDRAADNPKFDITSATVTLSPEKTIAASRFAPPAPPADDSIWPAGASAVTVPFRLLNNHIYVMASIDGKPDRPFMFDTGATDILDSGAAASLGVKVEGALAGGGFGDTVTAFGLAKVKSVTLGGLSLPDQVFGTFDSSSLGRVEGIEAAGLLGYELAKRAVLTIDYAKSTMTFTKPAGFQPPTDVAAIPFTFEEHIPIVQATIDGIGGEFEIDTGARSALTVMHPFAEKNKLIDKYHAIHVATVGYGVGGPSRGLLGRVGVLALGPVALKAPITDFVMDTSGAAAAPRTAGNIGGDVLKRFTVTLDYGHQKLWLQPNALYTEKDVFDRSGLWISRAKDGTIAIDDVALDSAGVAAGLVKGDAILAVDGKPAKEVEIYDLRERFKSAPGTKVALTIRGNTGERKVDVTLADQV